ncbi:MAG TPA: serine/threonine-protein kinase [Polyangiaceae bacterium]|jgi:serine/threonine protein kinase
MADLRSEQLKGVRFGAYEIVRLLGHGATASVYEAQHVEQPKRVALKLLHEHLADDPLVGERFQREAKIASQVHHPNVVTVLDVGASGGTPYLVMELLQGQNLRAYLAEVRVLDLDRALPLLLPIASALVQAHARGIIHRDVKPSNVFLAKGLRGEIVPKLVDFGLAKATTGEGVRNTRSETVAGTTLYMAPEQMEGAKHASAASDQYSFAAVVYECATGQPPFDGDDVYALAARVRSEAVRAPSAVNPALGEASGAAFDEVLLRALSRDPWRRFPDMRAFGSALLPFANLTTRAAFEREFTPSDVPPERGSSPQGAQSVPLMRRASMKLQAVVPSDKPPPDPATTRKAYRLPCSPGAGPFKVKGVAYRGLVYLVGKVLPSGMEGLCDAVGDDALRKFLLQPFVASPRYDIFPMIPAFATLARLLDTPLEVLAKKSSTAQAQYDAKTVYRALYEGVTLDQLPEKIARFNQYFYDFGDYSGETIEKAHVRVRFGKVPAFILPWFIPCFLAYCEESVRILGGKEVSTQSDRVKPDGSRAGHELVSQQSDIRWK